MSESHEHKSHTKEYIIVFFVLTFLTVVELMIPGLDTAYSNKAIGLIGLAVGKALVVAYFYMHLKEETAWLKFIAAIPISAAFLRRCPHPRKQIPLGASRLVVATPQYKSAALD